MRLAVLAVLTITTVPTLSTPTNPQHLDTARAIIGGSLWITQPTTTHDLGQVNGSWFSPFPPLPALLAVPAVLLSSNPDLWYNLMVLASALAAVWLAWRLGDRLGGAMAGTWAAVALGLGSGLWMATVIHDTYHSAHVFAVLLGLLGLTAARARPCRPFLAGLLLGMGGLARQAVVLGAPALAAFAARGRTRTDRLRRLQRVGFVLLGAALPMSLYLGLNQLRFGSFVDTGYGRVAHHERIADDVVEHGVFSWRYVPRNLGVMLAGAPRRVPVAPWLVPSPSGLSLLLVSPWLLLAVLPVLAPDRYETLRTALWCWLAAALISLPHLCYVNTGWVQFGYRFALDEMPFLLLAAILGARKARPAVAFALLGVAVAVNTWGYLCLLSWERWSAHL